MTQRKKYRTVIFYRDYFQKFFDKQNQKVQDKIVWTLQLIEDLEQIPSTYLKHLKNTDRLYEVRVKQGGNIFRFFCFLMRASL